MQLLQLLPSTAAPMTQASTAGEVLLAVMQLLQLLPSPAAPLTQAMRMRCK